MKIPSAYRFILFALVASTLFFSCRKRFETSVSRGDFRVSTDTVFLDSVFTGISSPTYSFKIYNTSGHNIIINRIAPRSGENSLYRLNVDGVPGKVFHNVMIPARDSIYVFVELTADISQLPDPVYEEPLLITDQAVTRSVLLTSFVKDAYFLYPRRFSSTRVDSIRIGEDAAGEPVRVAGFLIQSDTTLGNDKAVVIYGHIGVPDGKTLSIPEGAHLYFHYNSGIVVYEGGSIHIDGTPQHPVILEDDRLQPDYDDAPGMWTFIWLQQGSLDNRIQNAVIKNAVAGIIAHPVNNNGDKVLSLHNVQIYNCSAYGLFAAASYVTADNLVINRCGSSALRVVLGGRYDFRHCTLVNYGNGIRNTDDAAVYISNAYTAYDAQGHPTVYVNELSQCNILNSIIFGNQDVEFYARMEDGAPYQFRVSHSLIRFHDPQHRIHSPEMDFTDTQLYDANLLNGEPDFADPGQNLLYIGLHSDAIGLADPTVAATVPLDLEGNDRTSDPDSGAYQHRDLSH